MDPRPDFKIVIIIIIEMSFFFVPRIIVPHMARKGHYYTTHIDIYICIGLQKNVALHGFMTLCLCLYTPETQFSEPRFSEILNLMNKLRLFFSYFTLYPDSIL